MQKPIEDQIDELTSLFERALAAHFCGKFDLARELIDQFKTLALKIDPTLELPVFN
jgi:hypothetical protein